MANKNFIVKNGLEVGGQEVISSSGVVTSAALGGQTLSTTDSPTFADLTLTGNLNLTGDINSYNVTDLDVTDQTITLGAGQLEALSGGSGIIVDGSNASILWDETNDEWDFNKAVNVTGTVTTDGLTVDDVISIDTSTGAAFSSTGNLKIDIDSDDSQTDRTFQITSDGNSKILFQAEEGGDISFYEDTGTTAKFFWDASAESLGIGTTGPSAPLHVAGNIQTDNFYRGYDSVSGNYRNLLGYDLGNVKIQTGTGSTTYGVSVFTAGTERLHVDGFGRVLIGQDSGDAFNTDAMLRLQRAGDRVFIQLKTDADQNSAILFGDVDDDVECAIEYEPANKALTFSTGNNDEAMRIDSSGNVGINNDSPSATLHVDGTIKLDGNYPTGTNNVALGNLALGGSLSGSNNVAIGSLTLDFNTSGSSNTGVGYATLTDNSTGSDNTAVGEFALANNSTASNNTAVGTNSLLSNTTASNNTAVGYEAGYYNSTGTGITAVGYRAYSRGSSTNNADGNDNSAFGQFALYSNRSGSNNVAVGTAALQENTTASNNTAVGYNSLFLNTTGADNTAVGRNALDANVSGANNTAIGEGALTTSTASHQTAVGKGAGQSVSTGAENVLVGHEAGRDGNFSASTMIGRRAGAITTGINNTFVGHECGTLITTGAKNSIIGRFNGNNGGLDIRTSSNHIVLSDGDGNPRMVFENNGIGLIGTTTRAVGTLGDANQFAVAGNSGPAFPMVVFAEQDLSVEVNSCILELSYSGDTSFSTSYYTLFSDAGGTQGTISGNGGGTVAYNTSSDERIKENIVDTGSQLETIKQIQVRDFNYIGNDTTTTGMIAQELNTILPNVVQEGAEDATKHPWGIDYAKLTPYLIKAIQEQQTIIESLQSRLDEAGL